MKKTKAKDVLIYHWQEHTTVAIIDIIMLIMMFNACLHNVWIVTSILALYMMNKIDIIDHEYRINKIETKKVQP